MCHGTCHEEAHSYESGDGMRPDLLPCEEGTGAWSGCETGVWYGIWWWQVTEDQFVTHEQSALTDEGLWALWVRRVVLEGSLHEPERLLLVRREFRLTKLRATHDEGYMCRLARYVRNKTFERARLRGARDQQVTTCGVELRAVVSGYIVITRSNVPDESPHISQFFH